MVDTKNPRCDAPNCGKKRCVGRRTCRSHTPQHLLDSPTRRSGGGGGRGVKRKRRLTDCTEGVTGGNTLNAGRISSNNNSNSNDDQVALRKKSLPPQLLPHPVRDVPGVKSDTAWVDSLRGSNGSHGGLGMQSSFGVDDGTGTGDDRGLASSPSPPPPLAMMGVPGDEGISSCGGGGGGGGRVRGDHSDMEGWIGAIDVHGTATSHSSLGGGAFGGPVVGGGGGGSGRGETPPLSIGLAGLAMAHRDSSPGSPGSNGNMVGIGRPWLAPAPAVGLRQSVMGPRRPQSPSRALTDILWAPILSSPVMPATTRAISTSNSFQHQQLQQQQLQQHRQRQQQQRQQLLQQRAQQQRIGSAAYAGLGGLASHHGAEIDGFPHHQGPIFQSASASRQRLVAVARHVGEEVGIFGTGSFVDQGPPPMSIPEGPAGMGLGNRPLVSAARDIGR